MCKICIRNFNSPKNLPIETFFLFIKTCKFVSKDVCPIAWPNWEVWCRMICKNVKWFIRLQQIQRISVADNSTFIFRIFIYFGHTFVQSDTLPLIPHNTYQQPELDWKSEQISWCQMMSLAFFFTLILIPSLWDISEGTKAVFWSPKFKKWFGRHIFKVTYC